MADTDPTRIGSWSIIGVAAAVLGLVLVAYGITGLIFGSADFDTDPGGTVAGDTWLGIVGNGWANALFVAAGVLLILGSPAPLGVVMAVVVAGLVLAAAAIIALVDGDDVFGIAANGWTMLAWGVAAIVLAAALHVIRSSAGGGTAGVPRRDSERPQTTRRWSASCSGQIGSSADGKSATRRRSWADAGPAARRAVASSSG